MPASWVAGVVNYRTYDDLDRCLTALAGQTVRPAERIVVDCDPVPDRARHVASRHADVAWDSPANIGYSAGANRVLGRAEGSVSHADFVLLLNSDVELRPDFAELLLAELGRNPDVALASGKLLRPDGVTIDSAGIVMPANRRPRDRGSGETDRGQYDRPERVFGVTGAAIAIRRAALDDLRVDGELFDEDFWAYHEDTDLAWRAGLLGWSSLYVPAAVAIHRRGWHPDAADAVSPAVRRHSFKNHYLQMIKNERPLPFLRDLPVILAWEVLRLGATLTRRPAMLPAYGSALRLAGRAWTKRRVIQRRMRERQAGQE